jgi:hypothetical protein
MLPKAVLSLVGRFVGIAAVLLSPLAAGAAEASDPHPVDAPSKASAQRQSPSHGHRHKSADKKAKKRGSRHGDAKTDPKPATSRVEEQPEVVTERASAKEPPKQSATPVPTLAAAATRPLIEPISTKAEAAVEPRAHATEPRRTPIVRVSSHTHDAEPARLPEKKHAKPPCLHAPVSVTRGTEEETFALTRCDGSVAPNAVEEMSILVRPESAAKPASPISPALAKTARARDEELAPGIKKVDGRLLERLELVVDHFAKADATPKIFVVSGYRPMSKGSFHAIGRAIDFRLDGAQNTDLVAFCKTLPDTGCGFYPNSSFIHLDVRDPGAGHVSWIDASGPGEKPEYIAAWPPPPPNDDDKIKLLAKLDDLQLLPPPGKEEDGHVDDAKPAPTEEKAPAASLTRKLEEQ